MSLADQTIITAWTTAMAKIKVADGYHTTVKTVTAFEPRPDGPGHLPAIEVRDVSEEITGTSAGSDEGGADAAVETHLMNLEVMVTMNSTVAALREFIQDVRKCVRDNLTRTYDIRYRGHEKVVEQDELRVVGAIMRFDVTYRTALLGEE